MHAWEINMIYHDRVILIFPSVSEVYENIAQVQSINHWGNRLIFRWVRQMSAITIFTTKIFDKNRRKKNIGERTSCFTKENYIYIYIYMMKKNICRISRGLCKRQFSRWNNYHQCLATISGNCGQLFNSLFWSSVTDEPSYII